MTTATTLYVVRANESQGCTPHEVLFGSERVVFVDPVDAEIACEDLVDEPCFGRDGNQPAAEVGIEYVVVQVSADDLTSEERRQAIAAGLIAAPADAPADADDEDDSAWPANLQPARNTDGWCVHDTEGGTWWPSEEAQVEIQAAIDPEGAIIAMVQATPMRGAWHA